MKKYRFILEKGSKKHRCPSCGKNEYVRYVDTDTGDYLDFDLGRCDREDKCGYFKKPSKHSTAPLLRTSTSRESSYEKRRFFIPIEILKQTLGLYKLNEFLNNLLNTVPFQFETKDVEDVVSMYYLGTIGQGYMTGATTFPYIDIEGNIRAIQIRKFDCNNHSTHTNWIDTLMSKQPFLKNSQQPSWIVEYQKNDKKVSCLFGAHLLKQHPRNPIALVEAPKTAIYGALYFGKPKSDKDLIWLAVFNKSSFNNFDKIKALKGRTVYLYPDLSKDGRTFINWKTKAMEHLSRMPNTNFHISNLLEKKATDEHRSTGMDLADFLIRLDWRDFRTPKINLSTKVAKGFDKVLKPLQTANIIELDKVLSNSTKSNADEYFESLNEVKIMSGEWNEEIESLEEFFRKTLLPSEPVNLYTHCTIANVSRFLDTHFSVIKSNNGKPTFVPYLTRIRRLKEIIQRETID